MSYGSAFGIGPGYELGDRGVRFGAPVGSLRPALSLTEPPTERVPGSAAHRVKRQEHEAVPVLN